MGDEAGVGALTVELMRAAELPPHLMQQKDHMWNTELFYQAAALNPEWFGFLVREDGEPVGCWSCVRDHLYDALSIDTLVIDREKRTDERFIAVVRLMKHYTVELARTLGVRWVCSNTRSPKKFLAAIGDDRIRPYQVGVRIDVLEVEADEEGEDDGRDR